MKNESGITPLEFKVLVFPKPVEDKIGSIFVPTEKQTRDQMAQIEGTLIEASAMAFTDPDWPEKPKPGDVVMFAKYAGYLAKGSDGKEYRLIADKDCVAVRRA